MEGMPSREFSVRAWSVLGICAGCYAVGFALFPPRALIIADENLYVTQAATFAAGKVTVQVPELFSSEVSRQLPSDYPPGTSVLQTPFVWMGGWRSAPWASVLSLLVTLGLLAAWLSSEGFSPLYALLFLTYLPALVLGRVGMSDVPSGAIVTASLYLFWRGMRGRPLLWFAAGLLAGLSLLFRETNALVFAPFLIGAWIRGERTWPLLCGAAVGIGVRLLVAFLLFGSPLYIRNSGSGWSLSAMVHNAPLYLVALVLLVPGGLIAVAFYRGSRRHEVIASVLLVLLFFALYDYSASESGRAKQLVLGPRYLIPVVPLVVLAIAEVATRLRKKVLGEPVGRSAWWAVFLGAPAALAAFAVHPAIDRWSKGQAAIKDAIYSGTSEGSVLVTNNSASQKFISRVYGSRLMVARELLAPESMARVLQPHPETYLVLIDRSDSDWYRADSVTNEQYLSRLRTICRLSLLHDAQEDPVDRLRIWKIDECKAG
jgi:4-amino-4-deoxy-L-arabinose transferase-like glycosyltransferase